MNTPNRLLFALFLGATAPAQSLLFQVAAYENGAARPTGWGAAVTEGWASLQDHEQPGETTLLFAYTTIDITVAGPRVAAGITSIYPFLKAPDASWTGSSPELWAGAFTV